MKTLAMIKMEKNFIAQKKGYPRKPYEEYSLEFLIKRLYAEVAELEFALNHSNTEEAKLECADVSNVTDYIFEALQKEAKKQ